MKGKGKGTRAKGKGQGICRYSKFKGLHSIPGIRFKDVGRREMVTVINLLKLTDFFWMMVGA
ncbi:MAG: hypothetical protein DRP79_06155 [Planctomycetota bacterium]|nr:MAG: hypothetical protein DRP79_06155 [Planctomycetota bacterium]